MTKRVIRVTETRGNLRVIPKSNIRDVEQVLDSAPIYADGARSLIHLKGNAGTYAVTESVYRIESELDR